MASYKDLLRARLERSGWELLSINGEGISWWADEIWHVRSIRQAWGLQLVLLFLVDPMDESSRSGPVIWAVSATADVPTDPLAASRGVALLPMSKGLFHTKLEEFLDALEAHRNSQHN